MNNLVVNRAFTLNTGGISFNFELYLNIFRDSLSAQSRWKYFCMEINQFVSEIFSIGLIFITPSYFGKEVDGLVLGVIECFDNHLRSTVLLTLVLEGVAGHECWFAKSQSQSCCPTSWPSDVTRWLRISWLARVSLNSLSLRPRYDTQYCSRNYSKC